MNNKNRQPPKYIYNNYSGGIKRSDIRDKKYPKKSKRLKKVVFSIIILIIVLAGIWLVYPSSKHVATHTISTIIHPKSKSAQKTPTPVNTQALDSMEAAVNAIISANPNITFEVAVTDMNDGSQLNFGQTDPMTAASVSKILTATDFLNQVELGKDTMGETLDDGNTASYDLQQMIVVSNDNAWAALDDDLTANQLQVYAQNIGVTSFNYANNTLSARDTANVLTSLYQGKLLNSSDTKLLLNYLYQANYRTYILPAIPSSDTVYHKIGLYEDNVNDATIITNNQQTISLVIFTNGNGTYNWSNRAILMQDITKPILSYYQLN